MFLKIGVFMLPLVPVSIFFPLYYRLVTLFRRLPIRTVNLVSQNKCCFGTISNVFAAFIEIKTEIEVEILIVVITKIAILAPRPLKKS